MTEAEACDAGVGGGRAAAPPAPPASHLVLIAPSAPYTAGQLSATAYRRSTTGGGQPAVSPAPGLSPPSPWPLKPPQPSGGKAAALGAGGGAHGHSWQHQLLVLVTCVLWVLASSGAILANKHLMVDVNFPFPSTVAAIGMAGTSLVSGLVVRVLRLVPPDGQSVSLRFYVTYIVPAGLFLALAMFLGNTAYLYLSVAFIQMLKAFTPVATMLFAFLFRVERPSLALVAAVCLITGGVAAASWGEGNFSAVGVAAMLASVLFEGLRLVLMQLLVARRALHPMRALAYIAPAATAWMLAICCLTEALAIHQTQALADVAQHPLLLAASACAGFAVNAMAMAVIALTGALTLKCLGLVKDVALVLFGVAVLGEAVGGLQAAGYGVSLVGFGLYHAIKARAAPGAAGAPLRGGAHGAKQHNSGGGAGAGRATPPPGANGALHAADGGWGPPVPRAATPRAAARIS